MSCVRYVSVQHNRGCPRSGLIVLTRPSGGAGRSSIPAQHRRRLHARTRLSGVTETSLAPDQQQRLSRLDVSYPEVGHTRGELPDGYHHVAREVSLGFGPERFAAATEALFGWQLQRRAGVRVLAGSPQVLDGAVALLLLGVGPLALRAPVRVVYVVDEPHLKGFGYGTLPGHPESGEESFMIEQRPDGVVVLRITAFSRPVSLLARLGGPFAILTQAWVTGRYLRALFA